MKSIFKKISVAAMAAAAFVSCDYLDQKPDNLRTPDMIWETRADAEAYLNQVYSYIWYSLDDFAGLGVADETSVPIGSVSARKIIEGNWSASSPLWNNWTPAYAAIRTALNFEANIDRVPESKIGAALKAEYKCESKFLRGWFCWQLLRMYGPFVIIDKPLAIDEDFSKYARSPFDTCVEYICDLMEEAMVSLPDKRTVSAQYGRPTQGACLAVISQVRLLAASELWNGNPDFADFKNHDGTQLASLTYDENKWELAAEAAREVIYLDAHSLYNTGEPYLSFRNVFLTWNDEIIFSTNKSDWRWGHEKRCAPAPGGYAMQNATQNIVDAFYTRNGLDKDDDPAYTESGFASSDDPDKYGMTEDGVNRGYLKGESNMYVNREPRFYVSIQYNGKPVLSAPSVDDKNYFSSDENKNGLGRAEFYYSGLSGAKNQNSEDMTGYNVLKRISPGSNIRSNQAVYAPYIHIRYAEILLNYIEALNEYAPSNTDIVTYFNEIRDRAGIPGISATYPGDIGDKVKMREWIIRERQIELAFEGDRYWTLCRRKLFEKDENRTIGRMNVNADDGGQGFGFAAFYTRTAMPKRFWHDKMYLFPIPQSEIDKGSGLVQNPSW